MNNQTEREAAIEWYKNADWGNECFEDGAVRGFQAGADWQRAQQPQSAEAVAFYWQDVGCANPSRYGPYFGWPNDSALRNVDGGAIPVPLYTTPQPSAGVAVPERQSPEDEWHYVMRERSHGWNACLDEFARLNGKEVV